MKRLQLALLVADVACIAAVIIVTRRLREAQAQSWFWTPEWQAGEAEAERDISEGRFERFLDADHFLKALGAEPLPTGPVTARVGVLN